MNKESLKLVIPKGSLEQATVDLFRRAGWNITISPRSYFPSVDDDEIIMARLRAQEGAMAITRLWRWRPLSLYHSFPFSRMDFAIRDKRHGITAGKCPKIVS